MNAPLGATLWTTLRTQCDVPTQREPNFIESCKLASTQSYWPPPCAGGDRPRRSRSRLVGAPPSIPSTKASSQSRRTPQAGSAPTISTRLSSTKLSSNTSTIATAVPQVSPPRDDAPKAPAPLVLPRDQPRQPQHPPDPPRSARVEQSVRGRTAPTTPKALR